MERQEQLETLSNLLAVSEDGRIFYEQAVEKVDASNLEHIFTDMARHRTEVSAELIAKIHELGGKVDEPRTTKGKLSLLYGELLAAVSWDGDKTFVNRLEECEDRALEEFSKAINSTMPAELKEFVFMCHKKLQQSHDYMKSLKDHMEQEKKAA